MTWARGRAHSPLLLHWRDRDGWNADGQPVTVDGTVGAFSRAGSAHAVDAAGRYVRYANGAAARHYQYNPASGLWERQGPLLQGAGGNLVPESHNFAVTWTGSTVSVSSAGAGVFGDAGTVLDADSATGNNKSIAVGYTGDGIKTAFVIAAPGSATTFAFSIRDETAGVNRHRVACTWAGGVPSLATEAGAGTRFPPVKLWGGRYLLAFNANGVVAANSNRVYVYPDWGAGTGTTIIDHVQSEDATVPSSPIRTAGGAGSRVADLLTLPLLRLPGAMTVYIDFRNVMAAQEAIASATNRTLFWIGAASTSAPRFRSAFTATTGRLEASHHNNVDAVVTSTLGTGSTVAAGDRVEVLATLTAAGVAQLTRSLNAAAPEVAGVSGTPATGLAQAWAGTLLTIGAVGGGTATTHANGCPACVKVAAGLRSLAEMQAAGGQA